MKLKNFHGESLALLVLGFGHLSGKKKSRTAPVPQVTPAPRQRAPRPTGDQRSVYIIDYKACHLPDTIIVRFHTLWRNVSRNHWYSEVYEIFVY